ncbi:hypothetical protein LY78DRAFT_661179 [Colletotrichum sublineola]|nr:hypothetical protein LY78DRAFT_661179 [Colletotrichum sublineola]
MTDANDNPLVLLPPREPAAPMTQNNRAHDEDTKPKLNKRRRYINVTPLLQNQHQQAAPATSSDSTQRVNNTVAKELQQLQKQFSAELDSYNLHQELCWEAVKELDVRHQGLSESVLRMTKVQRQIELLVQNQLDQLSRNEDQAGNKA